MVSAEVDLAAPVLTQREMLNLTWSHRWRRRGHMRVYASREWQFHDSVVPAQGLISTSSRPDLVGGRGRLPEDGRRHRGSRLHYHRKS